MPPALPRLRGRGRGTPKRAGWAWPTAAPTPTLPRRSGGRGTAAPLWHVEPTPRRRRQPRRRSCSPCRRWLRPPPQSGSSARRPPARRRLATAGHRTALRPVRPTARARARAPPLPRLARDPPRPWRSAKPHPLRPAGPQRRPPQRRGKRQQLKRQLPELLAAGQRAQRAPRAQWPTRADGHRRTRERRRGSGPSTRARSRRGALRLEEAAAWRGEASAAAQRRRRRPRLRQASTPPA
mmetsp:Transcript_4439/g.18875  ORF Transcript_4439/g.18875 Transcript_4439/m.18875 type:complete len:238 (-) Transcript_4439:1179-1892(-)